MPRRRAAWPAALLLLPLLGCTQGPPDAQPAVPALYRELIDSALTNSPSDLERSVLADSVVTDEEHAQALEAMKTCVESSEHGFLVSFGDQGTTITEPDGFRAAMGGDEAAERIMNDVVRSCEEHTTWTIGQVYRGMRDNPAGLTSTELTRQCLEEHGIEDGKHLPDDEFEAMFDESYLAANPEAAQCFWGTE